MKVSQMLRGGIIAELKRNGIDGPRTLTLSDEHHSIEVSFEQVMGLMWELAENSYAAEVKKDRVR